jgi:hypothetical protein
MYTGYYRMNGIVLINICRMNTLYKTWKPV